MKKFIGFSTLLISLTALTVFMLVACTQETDNGDDTAELGDSYVTLEMNPAVSFIIDEDEVILLVNPLNEDGEILLFSLDIVGKGINEAIALLIDEAADLGFIDPEAAQTIIDIEVIGRNVAAENQLRSNIEARLQHEFQIRSLPVQVRDKVHDTEFINEAMSRGMDARTYRLAQQAFMADPELTWDDIEDLDSEALIAIVREHGQTISSMAQALKDDFLEAKQAVLDIYLPQIRDLEAQIEEAIENDEPVEALEADLEALKTEMNAALTAVVDDFIDQAQAIRQQIEDAYNDLKDLFEDLIPRP